MLSLHTAKLLLENKSFVESRTVLVSWIRHHRPTNLREAAARDRVSIAAENRGERKKNQKRESRNRERIREKVIEGEVERVRGGK